MLTKEKIEKFYNDVDALGLKFPNAEIARGTGFSKGQVSRYLQRKLDPSEDFIDKFYKGFYNVSRETSQKMNGTRQNIEEEKDTVDYKGLYIGQLQKENERMDKIISFNLHGLLLGQASILAHIEVGLELVVNLEKNQKTAAQKKQELDKRIAAKITELTSKGRIPSDGN